MDRLSAMRLFLKVVESGSISGAGRSLGLSSTAASKRLQDLETALGVRLLHRTTRHVAATEAGRHLYDRLTPLLGEIDTVLQQASEMHQRPAGLLRVRARRSFGMLHVSPALPAFRERHPEVEIDLTLTEALEITPTHGVDVVIRLGRAKEKSLESHRLASGRRVLCGSAGYLARHPPPADPDDLERHACLAYRRELEPPIWVFDGPGGRRPLPIDGPLRSNSGEVLRVAALDGMGLAVLPLWMVAQDLTAGRLLPCLEAWTVHPAGYDAEIFAVHARSPLLPAKIPAFIGHLADTMRRTALE